MWRQLAWIEIKLFAREPLTMLLGLAFPTLLLVLLAVSFGNDPDPAMGGVGDTDFYVPVYMAASIAVMGFLGIPTHIASYRERGVLRRFRASGLPAPSLIIAQMIVTALVALIGGAVMATIGFTAYDLSTPSSVGGVIAAYALGVVAFAALGMLLGSIFPTTRMAQGVGLLLFFGLFFIAGGGPPPYMLNDWINTIVDFTPMGPLVDAVSDPWHGQGWNPPALTKLATMGSLAALLAWHRLSRT